MEPITTPDEVVRANDTGLEEARCLLPDEVLHHLAPEASRGIPTRSPSSPCARACSARPTGGWSVAQSGAGPGSTSSRALAWSTADTSSPTRDSERRGRRSQGLSRGDPHRLPGPGPEGQGPCRAPITRSREGSTPGSGTSCAATASRRLRAGPRRCSGGAMRTPRARGRLASPSMPHAVRRGHRPALQDLANRTQARRRGTGVG